METEGPGIWNRIAMLRRRNVKLQRFTVVRLKHLTEFGSRFIQESPEEISAAIENRAKLLARVDAKSRERWPHASDTAHAAVYEALSEAYSFSDQEDRATLKALGS